MSKVKIEFDEWYPVAVIRPEDYRHYDRELDLPNDLIADYERNLAEFNRIQNILKKLAEW